LGGSSPEIIRNYFPKLFAKLEAKARRSLLPRFSEKRPQALASSFGFERGKYQFRWDRL